MIKQTLYFSNPFHLSTNLSQLIITSKESGEIKQRPIEDIGFVILDHQEITFTQSVIQELAENNVAVVFCDKTHHPSSMLFSLDGNTLQSERYKHQINASEPLKKQLWQQTIKAKIRNQGQLFNLLGKNDEALKRYATKVLSGDTTNEEAQAARHYWKHIFDSETFIRDRFGMPPNPTLNFGYTILRSAVARALVGSGLIPTLGIHHHNKYNAFCLADDIMEPYRPFVDKLVVEIKNEHPDYHVMTKEIKAKLIGVISTDVLMGENKSPLMIAVSQTTASLVRCFEGKEKQIKYPTLI
ncbi:MAG: type II CRISPR-associated endonuclease Cas1 [Bacteroidetes bacterium]|nr:type II CRISPR-associated endonuclease Cas1 [Bacteroidota bacterium]